MTDSNEKPTVLCHWHQQCSKQLPETGHRACYHCSSSCLLKASPTPMCLAVAKRGQTRGSPAGLFRHASSPAAMVHRVSP